MSVLALLGVTYLLLPGRFWLPAKIATGSDGRPDIILLTVDCLRADHVFCYGAKRWTTPALDALATRGARFSRAVAAADYTHPSICSLMTGASIWHHGAINPENGIVPDVRTVAETLHEAGYATGAFVNIVFDDLPIGLQRGFDSFGGRGGVVTGWTMSRNRHIRYPGCDRLLYGDIFSRLAAHRQLLSEPKERRYLNDADTTADAADLSELGLQWMRETIGKPRFLWIHYLDPHMPYSRREPFYSKIHTLCSDPNFESPTGADPNDALRSGAKVGGAVTDHLVDLYDSEIRAVDDAIARVIDSVDLKHTFVAATADHGEEFGEHGRFGHGNGLVSQALLVPLVIAGPSVPPRAVVTVAVSCTDLASTLREAAGISPSATLDGRSLTRYLGGSGNFPAEAVFSERQGESDEDFLESAILWPYHITFHFDAAQRKATGIECYDWRTDPIELKSTTLQTAPETELLAAAVARASALRVEFEQLKLNGFRYSPARVRQLRAMGYLK